MDSEREPKLRADIQLLLNTLIDTLAPSSVGHWVSLCKDMILTSARSQKSMEAPQIKISEDDTSPEDDSGMLQVMQGSEAVETEAEMFVPRWRTKLFSMECLRRIISLLDSPAHFDLEIARKESQNESKDFLVFRLEDIIRATFNVATSDIDSLRPVGIKAIKDIIEVRQDMARPFLTFFFFSRLGLWKC